MEARRLLTVAATLAGTDLTVQITGADSARIIESGGEVQVLDSSDTNQLAAVIPAASLTSITITPDGASPDTIDLTGVGLGADFTALQTITVAAGSASDATLLAGTITTTGDQVYGTGVTLGGPTTLTANGIHFSSAVSAPATQALTLSTTQDIAFDAAVGSAVAPLGAINVTGARNVTAASIDAASFTQAAGTGTTTLGGALDTTAAEGVSIDTATIDVNAAITSHDQAVSLTAATTLAITAPQNLAAASTTFTTDNLSLSADLSGTGNLAFQPVAAGDNVDLGGAGSGLSLTNAALAHLVDGFASLTFGRTDGTGLLTVQPGVSSFNDPVVLRMPAAGGALHINGDLVGAGNASFTLDGSGGTTTLNADIVTAGAPIAIHDSVLLGAAATVMLDTTDGGAVAGGANISFDTPGTIDDDATATALVLNAGTAGAITLAGAVGGIPIGSLTATAAAVNFNGGSVATTNDQTYNGQVVLGADAVLTSNAGKITFNGSVDAALATAAGLETHATTGGTFFNQPVGTGLNATNTAGLAFLRAFGPTTLNLDGKVVAANDETFHQAVTLQSDAQLVAGSVVFASTVDGAENLHISTSTQSSFGGAVGASVGGALASLTIDGAGATDLNGGAIKTSGDQNYGQAVQLTGDATLGGANVTFANTVDGNFALHVTSSGATKFENTVGGLATGLASLTLDGAGTTVLGGDTINTVGDQAYDQPVQLSSDANLAGANVTFASTVNGAFALTVTTTGITKFEQAVGATLPSLTKLTLDGAGITVLAADTIKTTGDQLFNQAVRLANNAALSGANVTFANTIDGAFALHVTTSGVTKFANSVGVTLPGLASLTLDGTGTTDLNGGAINTSGDQTYDQPVQLTTDATLVGANVTFASTVNGAFALHVTTTGRTTFEQAVGATLPSLTKLTLDGAGTTVLGGDTIKTSGDQLYNQAVQLTDKADLSGVNVTFASTIDGAFALHVTSSGTTKFENTVGVTLPGLASLTLDGAGLTDLNGGAINTSGDQTYDQPVQLTSNAALAGTNVTFAGTVDGAFALHVTTSGSTTFEQAVGATLPSLSKLTLDGAGTTILGGDAIKTSGDQFFNQAVRLANNADLAGANVTFANTVDGAFALHVTTSGTTTFENTVGGTLPGLASISLDGTGTTDLNGDAINTSGDQTYHQAVVLSSKADLKGANVTFANTIGGAFALHVTTSGTTKFENTLGVTLPGLASLSLDGAGTTDLNGGAINTSGDQTYDQPVQLTSDATLVGANVTFANTVDGAFALHATTIGVTKFENTVGGGSPLAGLTLDGAGTTDLNGGAVTTSGNQTYNQAVVLTSDATLTAANVAFNNTVDGDGLGPWNLTASVTGSVAFGDGTGYDAVGAMRPLKTLTVNGASLFDIAASAANHPSVTTVGSQTYNGSVRLAADAVLLTQTDNSGIAFASTIDDAPLAHAALTADTTNGRTGSNFGTVQFGGDVGAANPLSALTVNTGGVSGAFALNHVIDATGDVAITVFESVAGGANDNLTLNGNITSTGGNLLLQAGDNLTVAHGASIHAVAGSVTLAGDFNNNDPTAGTAMSIDGLIVSPTVSLTSGSGNDTIGLVGEIDATSLSISSGSGNDTVDVNGTITSGTVTIDAGSGNDTVNLRGTTNSPSVTINEGDDDDIVNVLKTMPGTTTINTGSGGDTVNVSSTAPSTGGTLTSITGLVAVHGDGADTLNVYDDGEAANVTGDLTSSTITGLGMGTGATHGIVYDGGLKTVNVALGSGSGLVFNVHSTPGVTAVNVTGQGVGAVNVGNNNQLKDVAGLLTVIHVHSLTLNDQNSGTGQSYDITGAAIGRPGVPPQVLVDYAQVAALALNTGDQTGGTLVDDAINLFLPRPGEAMLPALLQINGGDSPGGFHNRLYVVAPQDATSHNTKYTAHVGWFGSADPIQVKNIQSMWMYGSPVDSNDLANDTLDTPAAGGQPAQSAVPSVIIGGANFDTLKGGGGQDVIFGGGTPASSSDPASLPGASPHVFPEQLSGGGVQNLAADKSNQDYVFGDFIPTYGADGKVTFSQVSANGNLMKIDAGGGTAVSLAPFTSLNNATTVSQINGIIDVVTWLKARFASANAAGSLITEALANDAVLANLAPPPVLPPTVPTTIPASILTPGAGAPLATDAQIHAYVDNVYNNVFGHAPDAAGLQYWSAVLDRAAGATPSNHASLGTISPVDWLTARTNFTRAVTQSDEYYGSVVIAKAYHDYLGRTPDAAGLAYWIDQMQNHDLTDERLEAGFIGSQEFYNKAGGTDNAWIDLMYQSLLGRSADAQGEAYWTNQLAQHVSRADIAAGFTASLERERQRVEQDYSTYLGRQPDPQGVDYWVSQFANGQTNENLIAGFMASDEYFQKHSS